MFSTLPLDIKKSIWSFAIGNLSFPTLSLFLVCKEWKDGINTILDNKCDKISKDKIYGLWFIFKCFINHLDGLDLCYAGYMIGAIIKTEDRTYLNLLNNHVTHVCFRYKLEQKDIIKNNFDELTYFCFDIFNINFNSVSIELHCDKKIPDLKKDKIFEWIEKYYKNNKPWYDLCGEDLGIYINFMEFIKILNKNNIIELLKIIKNN